jgi:hypothetical protein
MRLNYNFLGIDFFYLLQLIFEVCSLYILTRTTVVVHGVTASPSDGPNRLSFILYLMMEAEGKKQDEGKCPRTCISTSIRSKMSILHHQFTVVGLGNNIVMPVLRFSWLEFNIKLPLSGMNCIPH